MRTKNSGVQGRRAHTEPLIRLPGTAAGARYVGWANVMHLGLVVPQQRKLQGCARTVMRHGPEPPAVILHDGTTDRQPHPHAL